MKHLINYYINRIKLWWNRKKIPNWWVGLHCNACGKNVFKHPYDYFFVRKEVWEEACKNGQVSPTNILCKKCTERMLGRKLTEKDFYSREELENMHHNEKEIIITNANNKHKFICFRIEGLKDGIMVGLYPKKNGLTISYRGDQVGIPFNADSALIDELNDNTFPEV